MARRVVITAEDLEYFRSIVRSALDGDLGTVTAVVVAVSDANQVTLETNGYVSTPMGPVGRPEQVTSTGTAVSSGGVAGGQSSGNPYANVPQDEWEEVPGADSDRERITRLEFQVRDLFNIVVRAERELGVTLRM